MDPKLQALLATWFTTGRVVRLRDLKSELIGSAKAESMPVVPIVSLAVGADDATDLRIETRDGRGGRTIERWRPDPHASGRTLDDVDASGSTVRRGSAFDDALAKSSRDPTLFAKVVSAHEAATILKARVISLRQKLEAHAIAKSDATATQAELADTIAKLDQMRSRFLVLKEAERTANAVESAIAVEPVRVR